MSGKASQPEIRAVLLDLDNTIYDFRRAAECSRKQLAAYLARITQLPAQIILDTYAEIAHESHATVFENGFCMRCYRLDTLARRLNIKFPIAAAAHYFGEQIAEFTSPYPGAVETVRILQKYYPVRILTEGYSDIQVAAAKKLGLNQCELFSTFQYKTRKGDGSAYKAIIQTHKLGVSYTVMIGDNWQNDIVAAAAFGIATIWVSHGKAVQGPIPERFLGTSATLAGVPNVLGLRIQSLDD